MFFPVPGFKVESAPSVLLYDIIQELNLTSGLSLCIDAADGRSYPGTGDIVYDLSSTASHLQFNSGVDNTAFAGVANGQSGDEYFYEADPVGSIAHATLVRQSGGSQPSWMTNLGKRNNAISAVVGFQHFDIPASSTVFSYIRSRETLSGGSGGFGLSLRGPTGDAGANKPVTFSTSTDGGIVAVGIVNAAFADNTMHKKILMVADPVLENTAYRFNVNGSNTGSTRGAAIPTNIDSPDQFRVSSGDSLDGVGTNARLYFCAIWSGTMLTSTNFDNLWSRLRGRMGL